MQKLTIVLLFALLALATATPMKFKKLNPANPEPQCSLLEIAACADEIGGRMRKLYNIFFSFEKQQNYWYCGSGFREVVALVFFKTHQIDSTFFDM